MIKIFTSEHCGPCQEVKKAIQEGNYDGEIEVVDVETDEGFAQFRDEVLSKGDGAVPMAFKDGQKCAVEISEEGKLLIDCPDDLPASEPDL